MKFIAQKIKKLWIIILTIILISIFLFTYTSNYGPSENIQIDSHKVNVMRFDNIEECSIYVTKMDSKSGYPKRSDAGTLFYCQSDRVIIKNN